MFGKLLHRFSLCLDVPRLVQAMVIRCKQLVIRVAQGHALLKQELFEETPPPASNGRFINATQRSKATIYQELSLLFPRFKSKPIHKLLEASPVAPQKASSFSLKAAPVPASQSVKVIVPTSQGQQPMALTYADTLVETPTSLIARTPSQKLEPLVVHATHHATPVTEVPQTGGNTLTMSLMEPPPAQVTDDVMYPISLPQANQPLYPKPLWAEASRYNDFYLKHMSNRSRLLSLQEALRERLD
jgi:hypothetical protein